ncbi:hypothetical protein BV22DRAFT_1037538 [Leucogyrophana mollusca]|uniref:Uncharacterized protein n=1 Tax=Leucogyrophana mollusca TaxID=85980 RepID=A0ACB8B9Y6_9AGAM|nr:hypothetical protein BV22DRAFT_1037538 [Leucogyrophana mollusca]
MGGTSWVINAGPLLLVLLIPVTEVLAESDATCSLSVYFAQKISFPQTYYSTYSLSLDCTSPRKTIIGCIIGGVILVALIGLCTLLARRRRARARHIGRGHAELGPGGFRNQSDRPYIQMGTTPTRGAAPGAPNSPPDRRHSQRNPSGPPIRPVSGSQGMDRQQRYSPPAFPPPTSPLPPPSQSRRPRPPSVPVPPTLVSPLRSGPPIPPTMPVPSVPPGPPSRQRQSSVSLHVASPPGLSPRASPSPIHIPAPPPSPGPTSPSNPLRSQTRSTSPPLRSHSISQPSRLENVPEPQHVIPQDTGVALDHDEPPPAYTPI